MRHDLWVFTVINGDTLTVKSHNSHVFTSWTLRRVFHLKNSAGTFLPNLVQYKSMKLLLLNKYNKLSFKFNKSLINFTITIYHYNVNCHAIIKSVLDWNQVVICTHSLTLNKV